MSSSEEPKEVQSSSETHPESQINKDGAKDQLETPSPSAESPALNPEEAPAEAPNTVPAQTPVASSPGMDRVKGYLLKMGKFMLVLVIVGSCLMLLGVWMITSTLDRILSQIGK